jgi:two-component system sensor kinase FixL
MIVALLVIWGAGHGRGPFVASTPAENVLAVQFFLTFVGITMMVIAAVIQERKCVEQKLRGSEERLATAFRVSPDAMAISRLADGRITEVNDRWLAMFGHRREEVIGRTVAEFDFYANERDREHIETLPERGSVRDVEIAFRYRTGDLLQTILSTEVVDIDGQPCLITIIHDITERRRAEMEMAQQRSELAHLSRVAMLGELSGSLAHELNQPLSAILANAQAAQRFLARNPASFDEIDDILKDIVADDKRAGEVIRRLRVLFKKEEMQHQSMDVNEVLQEVMQLMRSELTNRRVSVITRLAPDLPRVTGDRVHLQQVLVNLIINGADAMEGIEPERRSLTMQTTLVDASAVAMSVIDQGKGIPVDDIERIFEPFVTTKPHGMGLGLAVSRTIMQAHGGRLWAANNPDRGATFCLTLPCNDS